eukprot:jgi/Ulvmu1/12051/UM083_0064.1
MTFCLNTVSARRVTAARCPRKLRCKASSTSVSPPAVESRSNQVYDSVIVGAGISGLVTGLALQTKHSETVASFLITEARERVGGNITSRKNDDYIWEEGPNSFQPSDSVLEAAVDTGVEEQLVLGDPTAPRFVYWKQKLRATPSGPVSAVFGDFLSFPGKIRAGLGAVGLFKAPPPGKEESVKEFISRNLGEEVFYRLIEPFCSGVYAGDPTKLSMKAAFGKIQVLEEKAGSLVGGGLKLAEERKANPGPPRPEKLPPKPAGQTVGSFREGLQTLPEAIAKELDGNIRCEWKLTAVMKGSDGIYELEYSTPEGAQVVRTRNVALTAPSYVVADLLGEQVPALADALNSIDYPPVCAVTLAYPEAAVKDERKTADGKIPGFGQLHPRTQGVTTLGTIYSSSLFPGRAPEGMFLMLNYIGGATNRGILEQTDEAIVAQVDKDLRMEGMPLKGDAPKPVVVGVRKWAKAIPQFNVGHGVVLEKARRALDDAGMDGIRLGGNYVSGVALGKCIEYGYTFAEEISGNVKANL